MISAAYGNEIILFCLPGGIPVLYGHFQCYLYCHRSGVCIEYLLHRRRNQREQQLSQFNGRIVCQSAKHYVRHFLQLLPYCFIQYRMIVSMYRTPPRRHSFYKHPPVTQRNRSPFCPFYLIYRQWIRGRSIGMPQMFPIKLVPYFFPSPFSHLPSPIFYLVSCCTNHLLVFRNF